MALSACHSVGWALPVLLHSTTQSWRAPLHCLDSGRVPREQKMLKRHLPRALLSCACGSQQRTGSNDKEGGLALGSLTAGGVATINAIAPTCTWGEGKIPYVIPGAESAVVEQLVDHTAPRGGTWDKKI